MDAKQLVSFFRHLSKELLMGSDAGLKAVSVAQTDEVLTNRLEDLELIALCSERENDPTIRVSIEDLCAEFSGDKHRP